MATEKRLPPSAASLSASMRDLGYSLETAVADLVDNSISAEAGEISIFCDLTQPAPTVAVVDDGRGMSADEILLAMRHGAANPKQARSARDLGRFGLGLKTASFSQCRRLTVASMQNGILSAAEWDLDLIDREDDWIISILSDDEVQSLPFIDLLKSKGTLVLWRTLDRLFEDEVGKKRDEIVNEKLDLVGKHLSLVFHRFLSGEIKGRRISLSVNGHPIEAFDPFCRKSGSRMLPEEQVHIGDETVVMQPYILPHHSRLSAVDYEFYQGRSDFLSNQGAYIYRGGRLMAWGDWFRLIPKGEATKLARVQIDFPNSMDESWTIDIKKSRARPPPAVRDRLRQIIDRIATESTTVHRGRGRRLFDEVSAPFWERYADQGSIRFAVNTNHPMVTAFRNRLDSENERNLQILLESVSSSLPVEMIYSDYSTNPREMSPSGVVEGEVLERLGSLKAALFGPEKGDSKTFRQVLDSTRMFGDHAAIIEKFVEGEFDE